MTGTGAVSEVVSDKKGRVPSFSDVSERWAVYEELGSEIYELHTAVLYVHADYVSATELKEASPMVRAEFVLAELKATRACVLVVV
jgi:hypothetical protein